MGKGFQSPPGTRDFYPIELARRRFIEDAWRKVSIRHGFEEIDGPTFETIDLYKAKSGDAIVSEIFQVFSGKGQAPGAGAPFEAPFALRPEFTPTLARMYAARAAQLPKPAKWFWQQNCFRAERQQRGRLKEFMQWNCDILGNGSSEGDAEVVACCVDVLATLGLKPTDIRVRFFHRGVMAAGLAMAGIPSDQHLHWYGWLDQYEKLDAQGRISAAERFGGTAQQVALVEALRQVSDKDFSLPDTQRQLEERGRDDLVESLAEKAQQYARSEGAPVALALMQFQRSCRSLDLSPWMSFDSGIVRGLAYYTGMVFEVHEASGAERAVAGGGRYDNLIETFGGPATPAVGFGMGDVVLSLVLQDKGLMPSDRDIARALGLRPDVFVISNGNQESDAAVAPLLARLRRQGMHARRSYKATKNIGKLLKEAADADARYAVIIEGGEPLQATLKTLDDGGQEKGGLEEMIGRVRPHG